MVYLAGGTCANTYWPSLLDSAVSFCPVEVAVRGILAPGTRAPAGSLMVPRSEVVATWEKIERDVERMQNSIHPQRDLFTSVPPKLLAICGCETPLWLIAIQALPRPGRTKSRDRSSSGPGF